MTNGLVLYCRCVRLLTVGSAGRTDSGENVYAIHFGQTLLNLMRFVVWGTVGIRCRRLLTTHHTMGLSSIARRLATPASHICQNTRSILTALTCI